MKIERIPSDIKMTFSPNDGWAIMAALKDFAINHPDAVERQKWIEWADLLDKELRKNT